MIFRVVKIVFIIMNQVFHENLILKSGTPTQASPETSCDTSGAPIQHPSMQQMPHDGQYQTFDSCMQQSSFVAQQRQQSDQQQRHDHMSQMPQQHHQPQGQLPFNMNDLMHSAFLELRMIVEWARKVPSEFFF